MVSNKTISPVLRLLVMAILAAVALPGCISYKFNGSSID